VVVCVGNGDVGLCVVVDAVVVDVVNVWWAGSVQCCVAAIDGVECIARWSFVFVGGGGDGEMW
jgi:hypothetical protein